MSQHRGFSFAGIALASFSAGPLFLTNAALAGLYLQLPAPIIVEPAMLLGGLLMLIPAALIGAVLGLPINAAGATLMLTLANRFVWCRARIVWAMAGTGLGLAAAMIFEASGAISFSIIATSAVCALLCRRRLMWDDVS